MKVQEKTLMKKIQRVQKKKQQLAQKHKKPIEDDADAVDPIESKCIY